jgi:hypothetical protein
MFLDSEIITESAVKLVYGEICLKNSWFLPFFGGICMRGTFRMSNLKMFCIFLVSGPQYSYQKWHHICSTVKFSEQNSRFLVTFLRWKLYGR